MADDEKYYTPMNPEEEEKDAYLSKFPNLFKLNPSVEEMPLSEDDTQFWKDRIKERYRVPLNTPLSVEKGMREQWEYNQPAREAAIQQRVNEGMDVAEQYMPKDPTPPMTPMSEEQIQSIDDGTFKVPTKPVAKAPVAPKVQPKEEVKPVETKSEEPVKDEDAEYLSKLEAAQKNRQSDMTLANAFRAGDSINAAFKGLTGDAYQRVTADSPYLKGKLQQSDLQVSDVKELEKARKENVDFKVKKLELEEKGISLNNTKDFMDPNSAVSKAYRESLAKIDPSLANSDLVKSSSAYQIKQVYPMIDDMLDRKARQEERKLLADAKADAATEKLGAELAKQLDPDQYRAGNFANNKKILDRAERVIAIGKGKRPEDLTEQQIFELARGLEGVISGGVGTITGAMHLMPKNLQTNINGVEQWIQSKPPRAKLAEFSKMLMDAVVREQQTAYKAIQDAQSKRIQSPMFKKLKEKNPDEFETQVSIWGFDKDGKPMATPEQAVPNPFGQYKGPAGSQKPTNNSSKKIVRNQYSASANKTKLTYSDGTEEIVDGRQ